MIRNCKEEKSKEGRDARYDSRNQIINAVYRQGERSRRGVMKVGGGAKRDKRMTDRAKHPV